MAKGILQPEFNRDTESSYLIKYEVWSSQTPSDYDVGTLSMGGTIPWLTKFFVEGNDQYEFVNRLPLTTILHVPFIDRFWSDTEYSSYTYVEKCIIYANCLVSRLKDFELTNDDLSIINNHIGSTITDIGEVAGTVKYLADALATNYPYDENNDLWFMIISSLLCLNDYAPSVQDLSMSGLSGWYVSYNVTGAASDRVTSIKEAASGYIKYYIPCKVNGNTYDAYPDSNGSFVSSPVTGEVPKGATIMLGTHSALYFAGYLDNIARVTSVASAGGDTVVILNYSSGFSKEITDFSSILPSEIDSTVDPGKAYFRTSVINKSYIPLPVIPETVSETTTAEWSPATILGTNSPLAAYVATGARQVNFSFGISLDPSENTSIATGDELIKYLRSTVYSRSFDSGDLITIPPITTFKIYNIYCTGYVVSIGIEWGLPILNLATGPSYSSAKISISMVEVTNGSPRVDSLGNGGNPFNTSITSLY